MDSSIGELAEFGIMFERYRNRLLNMVRSRMSPSLAVRIDPDDIVQDAFVAAERKYRDFRKRNHTTESTEYAWLYQITRNRLFDAWDRETRDRRDLRRDMEWPEESAVQIGLGLIDRGTGPSSAACREEVRQQIQQVVRLLEPAQQEILWMRFRDQLSANEIATILEITRNAATLRISKAIGRLKDLWFKIHPNWSGNQ